MAQQHQKEQKQAGAPAPEATATATSTSDDKFHPVRERNYLVEDARKVASYLRERTRQRPEIAVVVGSRLRGFELLVEDGERVTFAELQRAFPAFPTCSVAPGGDGAFVFGGIDGVPVLVVRSWLTACFGSSLGRGSDLVHI